MNILCLFLTQKKTLLDWIQNSISFLQSSVEFFFISNNILLPYYIFLCAIPSSHSVSVLFSIKIQTKYNTTTTKSSHQRKINKQMNENNKELMHEEIDATSKYHSEANEKARRVCTFLRTACLW